MNEFGDTAVCSSSRHCPLTCLYGSLRTSKVCPDSREDGHRLMRTVTQRRQSTYPPPTTLLSSRKSSLSLRTDACAAVSRTLVSRPSKGSCRRRVPSTTFCSRRRASLTQVSRSNRAGDRTLAETFAGPIASLFWQNEEYAMGLGRDIHLDGVVCVVDAVFGKQVTHSSLYACFPSQGETCVANGRRPFG